MSSKLFHTIVGVGISLGAASIGCSSPAEERAGLEDTALTVASNPPAETAKPAADADKDAGSIFDAFCDATWPTTKGSPHRPPPACIDPTGACSSQGRPFNCAPERDDATCSSWPLHLSVCVGGAWQCKPGKKPADQCTCWDGDPACVAPPTTN
jgi:hypothetical protein